jgi:glutathione synthase
LYVQQDHHLILKDEMGANRHVALAYFMDGYLPEHFQPEDKGLNLYKIRQEMELSEAVIQPNIFVFFAGTKTVQQALTEPNVMESFVPEAANDHELESTLAQLRDTFIEQWRLSPAVTKMASEHAHLYVLKSNRQGGKGVLFGKDIQEELQKLASEPEEQKNEYILQKLVDPFYAKVSSRVVLYMENAWKMLLTNVQQHFPRISFCPNRRSPRPT